MLYFYVSFDGKKHGVVLWLKEERREQLIRYTLYLNKYAKFR